MAKFPKVSNMVSSRTGREVANQFIIVDDNGTHFQSYSTPIASERKEGVFISEKWQYSRTTMKYACAFLGVDNKKDMLRRISEGQIKLVDDLNKL